MKHHDLKILPKYYSEVSNGQKTYEVRFNDRDFKEGDTVTLKEFILETNSYSGNQLDFRIGYVLHLGDYFSNDNGYVVFSLLRLR